MPSVDVVDLNNAVVGTLELSDDVFGAPVNKDLLYEAVRHSQAVRRGGNAKTKTRHEVSGSGKKLWRQKGTGRARMGSIRSPLWRHGGTTHGPQPRDYSYKLPRKMMLGALRSALSAKVRDGELKVVQKFTLGERKTKNAAATLKKLDIDRKVLVIDNDADQNFAQSVRNIKAVTHLASRDVTPYHLIGHERVLMSESAARKLSEALAARKVIERAKGLLMAKENLTEAEAFTRLRKASQASQRPLKVIAEAVVATLGDDSS